MNFQTTEATAKALDNHAKRSVIGPEAQTRGDELSELATKRTLEILEAHGNRPSEAQVQAIRDIQQTMSRLFLGVMTGRHVFDLPTAMGKTTAIKGFAHAVHTSGLKGRIVICCEKVKAICDLRRDLIAAESIPEDAICLIHSYKFDPDFYQKGIPAPETAPYESDSGVNEDKHQFVLITHAKLHGGYTNLNHDLLIYDEGLMLGKSYPLAVGELCGRLSALKAQIDADRGIKNEGVLAIRNWLVTAEEILQSVASGKLEDRASFPRLDLLPFNDFVKPYIRRLAGSSFDAGNVNLESVLDFIEKASIGESVRFFESKGTQTLIFNPTIPPALEKLVILDASFNVRKINEGVESLSSKRSYASIKDCSGITFHSAKVPSGRQKTLTNLLADGADPVVLEAAALTARLIREGRKVLLFIHKEGRPNGFYVKDETTRKKLEFKVGSKRGRNLSVDPVYCLTAAILQETKAERLPEGIQIATWGHETAENMYGDFDAVICVTLNELPKATVYARRIDQKQDPFLEIENTDLRRFVKSEKAAQLLQAVGRAGRRIIGGKAAKMDAYVFSEDWDALKPHLIDGLPNANFAPYEPVTKAFANELPKAGKVMQRVSATLLGIPDSTISIKNLWGLADPTRAISPSTRKRVLAKALSDPAIQWKKSEQNLRTLTRTES